MHADPTPAQSTPTRLLLVANRTCPCPALPAQVLTHVGDRPAEVLVLAPALNSRLRHWVSDVDDAVRAAEQRMSMTIDELRRHGLSVIGRVGDADPLEAIADALATFPASTIMISTWPAGPRTGWRRTFLAGRPSGSACPSTTSSRPTTLRSPAQPPELSGAEDPDVACEVTSASVI
ncbi:MAG: hypothetical protein M3022_04810 [Actinomycetota bacterium]|nr:hypothetical protein [Actinomycetota bacterium]